MNRVSIKIELSFYTLKTYYLVAQK